MARKHNHKQLTKRQHQMLVPVIAFEITATFTAITDIIRARQFRHGNKVMWLLLSFVQPFGPWLYFWLGQKRK